jgi:hypothetical protein
MPENFFWAWVMSWLAFEIWGTDDAVEGLSTSFSPEVPWLQHCVVKCVISPNLHSSLGICMKFHLYGMLSQKEKISKHKMLAHGKPYYTHRRTVVYCCAMWYHVPVTKGRSIFNSTCF